METHLWTPTFVLTTLGLCTLLYIPGKQPLNAVLLLLRLGHPSGDHPFPRVNPYRATTVEEGVLCMACCICSVVHLFGYWLAITRDIWNSARRLRMAAAVFCYIAMDWSW